MTFRPFAFGAAAALSTAALAQSTPSAEAAKPDPLYLPYETPGTFAKVPNGPTIHIKCMGTGSPTVILTAGLGGWAADWRKVQPRIAKTTRVCAWDRPGFGFSSGTTQVQTVLNTTADLEAALKVAHIAGPYIAVGHSLGGYESLLFKDRNPNSVVGVVLVDPAIPDQMERFTKAAPAFGAYFKRDNSEQSQLMGRCAAASESHKLTMTSSDPEGCLAYPPGYPSSLLQTLDSKDLGRFRTITSTFANLDADSHQVGAEQRPYGNMPLIVLTATKAQKWPDNMPQAARDQLPAMQAEWARAHDEYAALSSRGVNRMIANSTHFIQYDQPQAVIDAVEEVIAAARKGAGAVK